MSDQEVEAPDSPQSGALPKPYVDKVPKRAAPVFKDLLALNHKERSAIFRAFKKEPPSQQSVQVAMMRTETSIWQGPLPPASELEKYNLAIPGGAERILAMAERQQAHRIALEDFAVKGQITQSGRGQTYALFIGILGIVGCVVLGLASQTKSSIALGAVSMGTLAVAFIVGKRQERTSRNNKTQP